MLSVNDNIKITIVSNDNISVNNYYGTVTNLNQYTQNHKKFYFECNTDNNFLNETKNYGASGRTRLMIIQK